MRRTSLSAWISGTFLFAGALAADPPIAHEVPRKTGNLSITSIRPALLKGETPALPDPMLRDPALLRNMGASSIEDYPTLDVILRQKDQPDFRPYLAHAKACRELRLGYAIYPWIHFFPDWLANSDRFVPYTNLETGEACRQPSGWAPQTTKLVEETYPLLAKHLGEFVDAVYVTDVAEYGELGYPNGYTKWLREDPNAKLVWWCGDEHARDDFRAKMIDIYKNLDALNKAWGTSFENEQATSYPPMPWLQANADPRAIAPPLRRRLLDFIYWYQDASALRVKYYLRVAQMAFPGKPCEVKLGHGSEAAIMGHSPSSACLILEDTPRLAIRSTHASLSYFHVKRVATPAHHCGLDFLTEPPGNVKPDRMLERIFTDACCGVSAYFDYPMNPEAAGEIFTDNIGLLDHSRAEAKVALFFPESDHYLRINIPYPADLLECAEAVRDVADFDVVDERLIADGALKHYSVLVVLDHPLIEAATFDQIESSVNSQQNLRVIQISRSAIADPPGSFDLVDGRQRTIKPAFPRKLDDLYMRVIDAPAGDAAITAVQRAYADTLRGAGILDDKVEALTARDNVWAGLFVHRILLYNRGSEPRKLLRRTIAPGTILTFPEGP